MLEVRSLSTLGLGSPVIAVFAAASGMLWDWEYQRTRASWSDERHFRGVRGQLREDICGFVGALRAARTKWREDIGR